MTVETFTGWLSSATTSIRGEVSPGIWFIRLAQPMLPFAQDISFSNEPSTRTSHQTSFHSWSLGTSTVADATVAPSGSSMSWSTLMTGVEPICHVLALKRNVTVWSAVAGLTDVTVTVRGR